MRRLMKARADVAARLGKAAETFKYN